MDNDDLLLMSCIVGAVAMAGWFVARLLMNGIGDQKLRGRLNKSNIEQEAPARKKPTTPPLRRLWELLAHPFMPKSREEQSRLRKMMGQAGIYSPSALRVLVGCKVIGLAAGLVAGYIGGAMSDSIWLGLSIGGILGYMLPAFWMRLAVKSNRKAIERGMADALDLMVVCVEAGLTIDAAMQRVGQEMSLAYPSLSRELGITHMETRVGLSRMDAMKNLGIRTGVPALQSLAAMLIQAERFGTSVASALRVHADALRQKRQHAAEEQAAKASVKMTFPLVCCIFPATFIVLAGPTVVELMHSALFN
jgi:tight adherence protein C